MNMPITKVFWVILALVVVGSSASYFLQNGGKCNGSSSPVSGACVPDQIVLFGNVDVRQVSLGFKVSGRIASVGSEEGDLVKKGQSIALLEKPDFNDEVSLALARFEASKARLAQLENGARPQEIAQAEALVSERKATVENARRTLKRRADLADQGFTAHQAHEDAEATLREAEARLNSAAESLNLVQVGPRIEEIEQARAVNNADKASLALVERRLEDTELFAPNEGTILTRIREPGAIVASGEPIYNLSLKSPVWVRTYIEEPDLGHIRAGMLAEVFTDSGGKYSGQIGFISPVAEFTPKTVETKELRTSLVYRLRVIVSNSDEGLRQGMPVTVILQTNGVAGD